MSARAFVWWPESKRQALGGLAGMLFGLGIGVPIMDTLGGFALGLFGLLAGMTILARLEARRDADIIDTPEGRS